MTKRDQDVVWCVQIRRRARRERWSCYFLAGTKWATEKWVREHRDHVDCEYRAWPYVPRSSR
jgi:hypothetical protein